MLLGPVVAAEPRLLERLVPRVPSPPWACLWALLDPASACPWGLWLLFPMVVWTAAKSGVWLVANAPAIPASLAIPSPGFLQPAFPKALS